MRPKVEIALDLVPGRVFQGKVSSLGFPVKQPSGGASADAMTVKGSSGRLRGAQRFPVTIRLDDDSASGFRFVGGQADEQVYTQQVTGS